MSTRCANCGWQNEEGHLKCTKCNYRLDGSLNYNDDSVNTPEAQDYPASNGLKSTIAGSQSLTDPWDVGANSNAAPASSPPPLGRPTESSSGRNDFVEDDNSDWGLDEDPAPSQSRPTGHDRSSTRQDNPEGFSIRDAGSQPSAKFGGGSGEAPRVKPNFAGTIDPNRQRVSHQSFQLRPLARDGEQERDALRFSGEEVNLNRGNLDPENRAITSREQARVEFVDGAWHIVDRSDLKTTSVQVSRPYRLESGDILIIGDRKFIFETE